MTIEELKSYELVEKRGIAELNSVGYYLKHKKTGAKVCLLSKQVQRLQGLWRRRLPDHY